MRTCPENEEKGASEALEGSGNGGEHILYVEHGMCMYTWKQGYEGYM